MVTQTGGDPRTGLGARLRSARERKGLTVLQAAEKLHVDARVVECLEAESYADLGAPVYVRGYLRHYAELVGESAAELQALYAGQVRTAPPDLTRIPKADRSEEPRQLLVPATLLVAGFALAGAIWWVLSVSARGPVRPTRPQADRDATSVAASPRVVSPPSPAAALQDPQPIPSPAPTTTAAQAAEPTPAAQSAPASIVASAEAAQSPAALAAPAPKSRPAQLTLRYTADSWTEVYDARGERLFYDVGTAGSVRTVQGRPPLSIVLGNAPGVSLEVDGRSATLLGHTRPDGSANVQVSRSGRIMPAPPAQMARSAQGAR